MTIRTVACLLRGRCGITCSTGSLSPAHPPPGCERLSDLRGRGVQKVFCAAVVPDIEYFVRTVGDSVLPVVGP